tara:strand:+ start:5988 stop:7043 length:1056 start_codon:yes stop_codon:yes gene_type:complete
VYYISIDNNFHIELAKQFINKFDIKHENITFISHFSCRNTHSLDDYNVINFEPNPLGYGYKKMMNYIKHIILITKVKKTLHFNEFDCLLILTEQQINNALYVKMITKKRGKVFLLDEGLGFYANNLINNNNNKYKTLFIPLYNFTYTILRLPIKALPNNEGRMFIRINDNLIDTIYSRFQLSLNRLANAVFFDPPIKKLIKHNQDNIVFFASDFSCFGLREEEISLALRVIEYLKDNFMNVFIKIHPQNYLASDDIFRKYSSLNYKNIQIIANESSLEEVLVDIKPNFVVGSVSTTLLESTFYGCHPIFTYHLLDRKDILGIYDQILDSLHYNYIEKIQDIKIQYDSNLVG